jgi:hypothetical protein
MPFPKVYWKGLRLVLGRLIRYITKWQAEIEPNISAEAYAAMIAVRNDAEALLVLLPVDTPTE